MRNPTNLTSNQKDAKRQSYNSAYDLINSSKNTEQLIVNLEKAIIIAQQSNLDEFDQMRLEEVGKKVYGRLENESYRLSQMCKHNKFKK